MANHSIVIAIVILVFTLSIVAVSAISNSRNQKTSSDLAQIRQLRREIKYKKNNLLKLYKPYNKLLKNTLLECNATLINKNAYLLSETKTIQQKESEISLLNAKVRDYAILQNNNAQLQRDVILKNSETENLLNIKSNMINELSNKIRNLTWENENDKEQITTLQKLVQLNKIEINNLRFEQQNLSTNLQSCRNETKTIQQKEIEISLLNAKVRDYAILQNNFTQLQRDVILKNSETENLLNIIKDLSNTIRNLTRENENDKEQITTLQKLVEPNKIEINNLRFEQQKLSTNLQSCRNENIKLKSLLTEITENPDHKKDDLDEVNCPPFDNYEGNHLIRIPGLQKSIRIPCNSDGLMKNWSVIERRLTQTLDFNRNWEEYRDGFGDHKSEFFVGLKIVHLMTSSQPHQLIIRLKTTKSVKFAHYSHFEVDSEDKNFSLKSLGKYLGSAGDGMRFSEGLQFSTFDRDNDLVDDVNCASDARAGWWFSNCGTSNLHYKHSSDIMNMMHWNNRIDPIGSIELMVRPADNI